MKKKDKYKIINYAFNEYEKIFNVKYERKYVSPRQVNKWLRAYKNSEACDWSYCCYGLYQNCWQEPYFEGNWGMTQKCVNEIITDVSRRTAKICRKDTRIGVAEVNGMIHMVIVARDIPKHSSDYFLVFKNGEGQKLV